MSLRRRSRKKRSKRNSSPQTCLTESRPLSDRHVQDLQRALHGVFRSFRKPTTRTDSIGTRRGQESMCVGINRRYSHSTVTLNPRMLRKPGVPELLQTLRKVVLAVAPTFTYTSVQINKDYPGYLHVDRSNAGPSLMFTVGSAAASAAPLRGGELWCGGEVIPTANRMIRFDGNVPHMTMPYSGTRYSVVLFTYAQICTNCGDGSALREATRCGLLPPPDGASVCRTVVPLDAKKTRLERAKRQLQETMDRDVIPRLQLPHGAKKHILDRLDHGKA